MQHAGFNLWTRNYEQMGPTLMLLYCEPLLTLKEITNFIMYWDQISTVYKQVTLNSDTLRSMQYEQHML